MVLGKRPFWFVQYDLNDNNSARPTKQQRLCTEEELQQIEPMVERVLEWLFNNPKSFPKSEKKFTKLLTNLCKISITVDTQVIYYHLLLNGVISEDPYGNIQVYNQFNVNHLRGFILDDSGISPTLSIDFCSTLKRVTMWAISQSNPPKTRDAFFNSLKQLCTFRREVPVTAIIKWFVSHEYISIDPISGAIDYSQLDNFQFASCSHYNGKFEVKNNNVIY